MYPTRSRVKKDDGAHAPAATQLAPSAIQRKLTVGAVDDPFEREADATADKVMRMPETPMLQRKCDGCEEEEQVQRKPLAAEVTPLIQMKGTAATTASESISNRIGATQGSGNQLPGETRSFMEDRFGTDFSGVKIHTGDEATRMNRELSSHAFTVGSDIYFNSGKYSPDSESGKHLLAHELTHTIQQGNSIRPYRPTSAFNFGKNDSPPSLVEDVFTIATDKETKPWIELITVTFTSQKVDPSGSNAWVGTAVAQYYANSVQLPSISFSVTGGSPELGRTDKGSFTVFRIEGIGYNSGKYSGNVDPTTREGPSNRYSKDFLSANMHFAVFYNGGEALHMGPLDVGSHGCVHVADPMQQINYHSVIQLTKVTVAYA